MTASSNVRPLMHTAIQPRPWRVQRPATSAKPQPRTPSLSMSDYWFMSGLVLALFYVADPFGWHLDRIAITKHLPLMFCLCGILLANVGYWVFPPKPGTEFVYLRNKKHWQVLKAALPLVILSIWIIIGSFYTRSSHGMNNTFITVGIYMLFTALTARLVMLSPARGTIIKVYFRFAAFCAAFMAIFMLVNYDGRSSAYHEMEAFVIPIGVYFALRPMRSLFWKIMLTLFFLAAGLSFMKNTGFLVLAFTLIYIWIVEWRFRFRESLSFKFWTSLWLMIVLVAGVSAWGYVAYQRGELMPTGNPQYRLKTYDVAWNRFLDSPLWGTSFTGAATEKFKGFKIETARGILATHSDVLDLAAQGGSLALLLWIWGYLRVGRVAIKNALGGRPYDDMRAGCHALACMSLASIIVYAFNPILLQPAKALLLWGQAGILLGVALYLASLPKSAAATETPAGKDNVTHIKGRPFKHPAYKKIGR